MFPHVDHQGFIYDWTMNMLSHQLGIPKNNGSFTKTSL